MTAWSAFQTDLRRYVGRSWWSDRTIYAIVAMRLGQWIDERPDGVVRKVLRQAHSMLNVFVMAFTGVEIARGAQIGPGLKIVHGNGIVIGPGVRIGSNCSPPPRRHD